MLIWCVQISGISVPTDVWNLHSFLILVSHQRSFGLLLRRSKFHSRNISKIEHRVVFQLQVNTPSKRSHPITYLSCYWTTTIQLQQLLHWTIFPSSHVQTHNGTRVKNIIARLRKGEERRRRGMIWSCSQFLPRGHQLCSGLLNFKPRNTNLQQYPLVISRISRASKERIGKRCWAR